MRKYEPSEKRGRALGEEQGILFLALTFVLVIIVVMLCPDAKTAIMIVGLLFGFVFAYDVMVDGHALNFEPCLAPRAHRGEHHNDSYGEFCCTVAPATSAPKRPVRTASHRAFGRPRGYPGAIDSEGDYDMAQSLNEGPLNEGHRDRAVGDNVFAPEGNPFNINRVGAPHAASACFDDEANDDELDGDERINYQARSRNDPTRVTAGTMNRRCDLDKYLREEVEEEDNREWWGRHEG
jgi:hypothetical protein